MRFSFTALIVFFVVFIFATPAHSAQFTKEQFFQLATLAAKDEQFDQSEDLFEKALELDPKFAPAYNGLGLLCESRPEVDLQEAARYFRLAVQTDSQYVESWNNLGKAYYNLGRFIQAEEALRRSIEIQPGQADIELMIAWILLLGESKPGDAVKFFQSSLKIKDNDTAHYGLGLSYLLNGERFKAFDEITILRKRDKKDLAEKLEAVMKQGGRLVSEEGKPLVTGDAEQTSAFEEQLKKFGGAADLASPDNIKVRLRGPLTY